MIWHNLCNHRTPSILKRDTVNSRNAGSLLKVIFKCENIFLKSYLCVLLHSFLQRGSFVNRGIFTLKLNLLPCKVLKLWTATYYTVVVIGLGFFWKVYMATWHDFSLLHAIRHNITYIHARVYLWDDETGYDNTDVNLLHMSSKGMRDRNLLWFTKFHQTSEVEIFPLLLAPAF